MNKPLVSIITVCFNSEKTIEKTIKSVINQDYENIEYIIVDGQSTDKTIDIIQKYKSIMGEKLKFISEKDNGIYDAMNKGIDIAKGTLIGIINSDDWYENNAIKNIVSNYDKSYKYQIIYGYERVYDGGRESHIILKNHEMLKERMICHSPCFVTKDVYEDFGKFNLNYKVSADYEFMLRIYLEGVVKFKPIDSVISNFCLGGISSTQKGVIDTARLKYKYKIINKKQYLYIIFKSKLYNLKNFICK